MEGARQDVAMAEVARRTIDERRADEDLDEALLRACKHLYGDSGVVAFESAAMALTSLSQEFHVDREEVLRGLAEGKYSSTIVVQRTRVVLPQTFRSVEDMPPELRKAFEGGRTFTLESLPPEFRKRIENGDLTAVFSPEMTELLKKMAPSLPPATREQLMRMTSSLDSGVNTTIVSSKGEPRGLGAPPRLKLYQCPNCAEEYVPDTPACPRCGTPTKRSFWSRLSGK